MDEQANRATQEETLQKPAVAEKCSKILSLQAEQANRATQENSNQKPAMAAFWEKSLSRQP
jgi:hypothetical protein